MAQTSSAYGIFGCFAMNRKQRRAAKSQSKATPGRPAPVGPAGSSVQIAERFAAAVLHHQAGRLVEAESLYRQICAVDPYHVDSLHFLGVLAGQVGRNDIAIDLIGRALALKPDYAEAHYNLGNILAMANKLDQAAAHYRQVLAFKPDSADVHHSLGIVLLDQGKSNEAMASFERALALKPDFAEAHYNQGIVLTRENRLDEAVTRYQWALALKPNFAEVHNSLGTVFWDQGRPAEAMACFERALALKPDYHEAHNNLGKILREQGRLDEAVTRYQRALALKPDFAEAHNGLGAVRLLQDKPTEAMACFERALVLKPDFAEALNSRGIALRNLNRPVEALASLDKALEIKPDDAEMRWNRMCLQLLVGDFDRGWEEHEWRWKTRHFTALRRDFAQPLWLGKESLEGRTILLHAEQGLGDTIQFARYAPLVAAGAAKVIFEVQPPLKTLLSGIEGASLVIANGENVPTFDYHCPLLSLPLAFKTSLATIPATIPYLSASEDRVIKWRGRLPKSGMRRIGIAWAGNPSFKYDQSRSIGLSRLLPLLSATGVEFLSIQKDLRAGDRDILRNNSHVMHWGDAVADFSDTAAIMSLLDLVISSDTSIVHLAGALGKPVWVLLQYAADWRWLLDRADSPWYPTARLFRQPKIDDWESVLQQIQAELARLISTN
jgi:tetratricopeptide (TPR) repeat protein